MTRPEAFPTGRAAHKTCVTCKTPLHVYMFPIVDRKTGDRGPECNACEQDRATADRLRRLRK